MNVVEPITVGPVGAGYLPEIDMSRPPRLTRRDVFLLSVAIAIVATIVVGSILFREKIEEIGGIGYVGIVLANAIGSATIVLPVPTIATVVIGATIWNPVLVGIAGATGSTIGEFTAYVAGASARSGVDRMMAENRWYSRAESWMKRRGFLTVFLLAATPNPFMGLRRNRGWLLGLLGAEVHRGLLVGQGSQVHADRPSQLLVGGRNPAVPRLVTEAACRHQDLRQSALKFRSGQQ